MAKNSKRIGSLTENTKEANVCAEIYFDFRDQLLEMHYWNFAVGREQLVVDVEDVPTFGFEFAFQLPLDFSKIRSVYGNSEGRGLIPYKHEDDNILTDSTECYLIYAKRITDPNRMSALFRRALSRMMSANLAMVLSNSASRSEALEKQFENTDYPRAKSSDSIQDYPDQLPESEWVTTRYGGFRDFEPAETV